MGAYSKGGHIRWEGAYIETYISCWGLIQMANCFEMWIEIINILIAAGAAYYRRDGCEEDILRISIFF